VPRLVSEPRVTGWCAPQYTSVRDAFESCFAELGETGAALACTVDGELVVDLHGGWKDAERTQDWTPDTLVHVWSVTKPFAALAVLRLVDRGAVELDERVAAYWPEYAMQGKAATTVRHVLAHQAGFAEVPDGISVATLLDHDATVGVLAASPPAWSPGSGHGEHALLYGHLLGEIVRRVDGRSLGTLLRDEVSVPGRIDFHIGLRAHELLRVADAIDAEGRWRSGLLAGPTARYLARPEGVLEVSTINSATWRCGEVAAVNGHASAQGVARLYAALAAGGELEATRLLSAELVEEMLRPQAEGEDVVLGRYVRWGLGVQIEDDGTWGMGGIGGSLGYGRRAPRHASFGYVTARMRELDRAGRCADAFDAVLGA
jgi:CubicO group peptidase (beta-lactamase class C family)